MEHQRITIVQMDPPANETNAQLQWFARAFGLFNTRDKDRSCYRIFIEIIKVSKRERYISSEDLARRLNLSRGTVVHHLNKLLEVGLILSNRNKYMLRKESLSSLVDEIEKDSKRIFQHIREAGEGLDAKLSLRRY